jgi:hypothetical protein
MQRPARGMEQDLETLSGNSNPRRGKINILMGILPRPPHVLLQHGNSLGDTFITI